MAVRNDYGESTAVPITVPPNLTPRESLVLEMVAEGLPTRQIAESLFVSEQAITFHVGNLLSKFGCDNRTGLVARAFILRYLDAETWPPRLAALRTP